jgi:hypothetical protein
MIAVLPTFFKFSSFSNPFIQSPVMHHKPDIPVVIHGNSLRTWGYRSLVEQVQISIFTEGRPLDSDIELWNGPDNTPYKVRVYTEDGAIRPFNTVIETPRGSNTVSIKNIGQLELPLTATVEIENIIKPSKESSNFFLNIQGGALRTYPFDISIESVEVILKTNGRPLNARIEVLQGPTNNKQVVEIYTEDGCDRPFFCILETPGSENIIRILNTAPVEFPMLASIYPKYINPLFKCI